MILDSFASIYASFCIIFSHMTGQAFVSIDNFWRLGGMKSNLSPGHLIYNLLTLETKQFSDTMSNLLRKAAWRNVLSKSLRLSFNHDAHHFIISYKQSSQKVFGPSMRKCWSKVNNLLIMKKKMI